MLTGVLVARTEDACDVSVITGKSGECPFSGNLLGYAVGVEQIAHAHDILVVVMLFVAYPLGLQFLNGCFYGFFQMFVPAGLSYYDSDDDYRTVVGDLITYDVDGAKELLEEAKADGFDADATYEIIIKNDDELKLIAQAMQAMWKQNLGLNFTITTYESGSYWDEFYDGNFDVAFDGWTGDYDDPNTMLECFTQKACATQNRWSGEKAEEYDQIIADCATMTDQTERYTKFAEAEKILMDESPILPLYYRKSQLLVGTNVAKAVNDTLGHTLLMYTELS